jgi:hypothetical protein
MPILLFSDSFPEPVGQSNIANAMAPLFILFSDRDIFFNRTDIKALIKSLDCIYLSLFWL